MTPTIAFWTTISIGLLVWSIQGLALVTYLAWRRR